MKKIIIALLLVLVFVPGISAGADNENSRLPYTVYQPFEGEHLFDTYGLLTPEEQQKLEALAAGISREHNCGIYIMTVEDYRQLYGHIKIFKTNYTYYHEKALGYGEGRDGVMLLLSMKERDFSFFVYGDAEYALNHYGQILLESAFIGKLRQNRWYEGGEAFANFCDHALELAAEGRPLRRSALPGIIISLVLSVLAAIFVVWIRLEDNKEPVKAYKAHNYISQGLHISSGYDKFYNSDVIKTRLNEEISSSHQTESSTAHIGGGGSGRSGKF